MSAYQRIVQEWTPDGVANCFLNCYWVVAWVGIVLAWHFEWHARPVAFVVIAAILAALPGVALLWHATVRDGRATASASVMGWVLFGGAFVVVGLLSDPSATAVGVIAAVLLPIPAAVLCSLLGRRSE